MNPSEIPRLAKSTRLCRRCPIVPIQRIEATGDAHRVKIEYENGNATCYKAVHFVDRREDRVDRRSHRWERGTRVSGKQITIFMAEERVWWKAVHMFASKVRSRVSHDHDGSCRVRCRRRPIAARRGHCLAHTGLVKKFPWAQSRQGRRREVYAGEVVGFSVRMGAGKTTFDMMVVSQPDEGDHLHRRIRDQLAHV